QWRQDRRGRGQRQPVSERQAELQSHGARSPRKGRPPAREQVSPGSGPSGAQLVRPFAIVLGSASNALAEYEAALALAPEAVTVCINDALGVCTAPAVAFATLHPDKIARFLGGGVLARQSQCEFYTLVERRGPFPWKIVREKWGGSSGLYGVQIALDKLDVA